MKTTLTVILLLVALVLVFFFVRGFMSRSGSASGLMNNQLAACSDKPNCVCSEVSPEMDSYISPITLPFDNLAKSKAILVAAIVDLGGQIQAENDDYLAATFTSAFFGFVDDLEARLDVSKGVLHIRSASRVGHSDFGINRKRVELLKRRFTESLSNEANSSTTSE